MRSLSLSDELTLQDILEVQAHFGLPSPALVEKDFHVVKALAAIAALDLSPFQLIFGGGTALARAHRLIQRMSEDIDLKVVGAVEPSRTQLRRMREEITNALLNAGFRFDPTDRAFRQSANESRYTVFRIPYEPLSRGVGSLRPEIQIEVAVWPLRRPPLQLPISSFVAEAFQRQPEIASIPCVSITQTAAEKFVALTRRIAAEIADAGGPRDSTLVRHIYDLHVLKPHYDPIEMVELAGEIMPHDAAVFGNQFPAYRDDSLRETRRAVEAMASDPIYAQRYADFQRDMVYGQRLPFAEALQTIIALSKKLR